VHLFKKLFNLPNIHLFIQNCAVLIYSGIP
jgi:hypothetical protein